MSLKDLIPWRKSTLPAREMEAPFRTLRTEMDRLFDQFFRGFEVEPFEKFGVGKEMFSPRVNVTEDETAVNVSAELPGIEEKDLEVFVEGDTLTIKGEKKEEIEKKNGDYVYTERVYGSFRRVIPLPAEVKAEKIEAAFKKGVLNVTLPKAESAKANRRKIPVKAI
jgi:HSP20 family protein